MPLTDEHPHAMSDDAYPSGAILASTIACAQPIVLTSQSVECRMSLEFTSLSLLLLEEEVEDVRKESNN